MLDTQDCKRPKCMEGYEIVPRIRHVGVKQDFTFLSNIFLFALLKRL